MASPFQANIVQLSSGHVLFNDPTKSWTPDDFPNLPSTSLSLTSRGRIEDGTFSTIRFTNAISYEPYEPVSIQSSLKKTFLIGQNGDVEFGETKMGFVSTVSAPFDAHVTGFTPSTIGGAQIFDSVSGVPDTTTNAIAKLDAWINNAFLQQPPAVQVSQIENTSLFAGVRWNNFNTYRVLEKFVPYATSISFIIGDPSSSDYLTFEVRNCRYLPYKTYRDGISPDGAPLVRLRLFDEDFGVTLSQFAYKKSGLATHGITILSESGNLALPSRGPVLGISETNGVDTYTTISLFIPNLRLTYPLDTEIPVRVFFLNHTEGDVNTMSTFIMQRPIKGPSAPVNVTHESIDSNSIKLIVERPLYSDSLAQVIEPYFSTYVTKFTFKQMATAHSGNIGFQYGLPSPTTMPSSMSTFMTTYVQNDMYYTSTQTLSTTIDFYPGTVWSTSVTATNLKEILGDESQGLCISTSFAHHKAPRISSVSLIATNPFVAQAYTRFNPTYVPGSGWSIGTPIDHAIAFVSTPSYLTTTLSTSVQFNDPTFPGDRSTMTVKSYYIGTDCNSIHTDTLYLSSINDRFELNTFKNSFLIASMIEDTESNVGYTDFFYKAQHTSYTLISTTFGYSTQEAYITFTNNLITGFNAPIVAQTYSTPNFVFETRSSLQYRTSHIVYGDQVTSTIAISGLYTPSPGSIIHVDLYGSNFSIDYVNSNFACAEIRISSFSTSIASNVCMTSNQYIFNANTGVEITSTPFPVDTMLNFSSIQLSVNDLIYTDPIYNYPLRLIGQIASVNPEHATQVYESTISTLYVDTYSYHTYTYFSSSSGVYGQRVLSLLPRLENPGTPTNMNDGISYIGDYGQGLNVSLSSFMFLSTNSRIIVSSFVEYNHTSSLSTSYTNPYSRELLYTYGRYIHPAGYNFSPFNGSALNRPEAIYPDFTYDMYFDENKGNRFASFFYEQPVFSNATPLQYMMIAIHRPSFVSTITQNRSNNFFPASPVVPFLVSSLRVHMHAKVFGEFDTGTTQRVETAWINCFKQIDELTFNDAVYDVGGCSVVYVPQMGSNSDYIYNVVHFNRRYYTKIGAVVRIGISYDACIYSGDPITFEAVSLSFSD